MKLIIAFLFIGISLHSFYFYQLSTPLFSVISLFILSVIVVNDIKIDVNNSNYVFVFYFSIFLFSIFSLVYFNEKLVLTKLIGFLIIFLASLVANNLFAKFNLFYLIRVYLKFHILFFYLQFLAYYLFKIHIDFLFPITGEEQRVFGGSFELPYFNSFMRASGLFNEPGTYVTFVAPIIVLFGRWSKHFSKTDKILYILSFMTLFLSFSVFGILFGILILLFASIFSKKIILIIGSIFSFTIVIPYFSYRFFFTDTTSKLSSDSGLGFREVFLNESYKFITNDLGAFFFGSGHLSLDPKANFIASYNDIGLIPYLIHFSGPFLTGVLLLLLLKHILILDKFAILGLLILLISKLSILSPFFPLLLTILLFPKIEKDFRK